MITVRDIKKVGFIDSIRHSFHDDGNYFKGFEYDDVIISYLKSGGEYYLSIRVDYMQGLNYEEYSKLPSYKDTHKFDGVEDLTIEDLKEVKEICIRIKKEYKDKLNSLEEITEELIEKLQDKVDEEVAILKKYLDERKEKLLSFILSSASDYEVTTVRERYKSLQSDIERKLIIKDLDEQQIRYRKSCLERYGYIYITMDCYYVKQINSYLK